MKTQSGKLKFIAFAVVLAVAVSVLIPIGTAFAASTFDIPLLAGEGSGSMDSITVNSNSKFTLPECTFTPPEGKEFDKWLVTIYGGKIPYVSDDAHANGLYDPGDKIATPAVANANMEVTAKWKDCWYTVNFEMHGAKWQEDPQKVKHGGYAREPYSTPKKVGYVFVDWYKDAELTEVYDFDNQEPITDDTTIYAGWGNYAGAVAYEKGVRNFSKSGYVSVNGDKREYAVSALISEGDEATFSAEPKAPGYRFAGWYVNKGPVIPTPVGQPVSTEPEFTEKILHDTVSYCAEFRKCEATFDSRGGAEIEPVTVNDEGKIVEPKSPQGKNSSYKFEGWYTDDDFNENNKFDFNTVLTDDVKLYARYKVPVSLGTYDKPKEYTSGGGSVKFSTDKRFSQYGPSKIALEGEEVTAVAEPKENYTFVGWALDTPDGKIVSNDAEYTFTVYEPVTLYAVFDEVHEHDWGKWVVLREPTEEMNGEAKRVCKLDPSHVEVIELSVNDGGDDGMSADDTVVTAENGTVTVKTKDYLTTILVCAVCGVAVAVFLIMFFFNRKMKK